MSQPNMSGRTDAPSTDTTDHVDPSDLLGDDGTIDTAKVKQVTNRTDNCNPLMTPTCKTIRRRLLAEDLTAAALAEDLGYGQTAVRNHARGRCSCDHDVPTIMFDRLASEWVVDDE